MSERSEEQRVELLRELTLAPGPAGSEQAVRAVVRERVESIDGVLVEHDRLGSVVMTLPGGDAKGPRVVLDAHLD